MKVSPYTPDELEAEIQRQVDKVQTLFMEGKSAKASEEFKRVKELVAMRTPETIERMEKERGLFRA